MNDLESINNINFSSENIPKIFERQRTNLQKDILFLKEDILKDFREIETKLSTKYEKQNSNIITKLHKFENKIEALNNKIIELSSLISTDKNIQHKVLNLNEFQIKLSDKLLSQEIAIKANESKIKDVVDKYDKILNESIIYQGIIGNNARFQNFHHFIDYILLNINEFVTFKDKNVIDFKGYKTKLETLFKSLKMQADSIVSTSNKHTNKKFNELEKKFKELINIQDAKVFDIKLENNKFKEDIQNKIKEMNNEEKKILDIKDELKEKISDEIDFLKDFNKGVTIKIENNENEINSLKEKFQNFNNSLKDINIINKKGEFSPKKNNKFYSDLEGFNISPNNKLNNKEINVVNNNNFNSNINIIPRRSSIAKSIIKQYITGEIGIKELERNSLKKQKRVSINENNIQNFMANNIYNKNNNSSLENKSKNKRMTLGPDKIRNFYKINNNLLNKIPERKSIYSEKTNINKSNNSISEEKSEDIDYINSFREKSDSSNSSSTIKNRSKDNKEGGNKEEGNKNKEKDEKLLLISSKKKEINSFVQTDIMNKKDKNINSKEIDNNYTQSLNSDYKMNKYKGRNYSALSSEKLDLIKNDSYSKFTNIKDNNKIENQKLISTVGKLRQIGGGINIINYNNTSRFSKTSILFYDNLINKKNLINNNNQEKKSRHKLNIIEMNFDEPNKSLKEDDELKSLIKKIKENRINILSDRNSRPLKKNKSSNRLQMSDYDTVLENNSIHSVSINKSNYYFIKKMIKEDLQKNISFKYLKEGNNNKRPINMKSINLNKKKSIYGNIYE